MLEFYQSYATYEDMMKTTEELLCSMVKEIHGGFHLTYQGKELDFTPPWKRISFNESLLEYGKVDPAVLKEPSKAIEVAKKIGLELKREPLMEEFSVISLKRWSNLTFFNLLL